MKRSKTCITTERLWLRQIDETDADSIVTLRSSEDVYRFFFNPIRITVEDHKLWYINDYCKNDVRIDWVAIDNETGEFVGVYGIKRNGNSEAEISYITVDNMKGKGYASEAVGAIMEWCNTNLDINLFYAQIHADNIASISFAKRNGFSLIDSNTSFLKYVKRI